MVTKLLGVFLIAYGKKPVRFEQTATPDKKTLDKTLI